MGVHEILLKLALPTALLLGGCSKNEDTSMREGSELSSQAFEELNMEWRERRVEKLTEPHGWLSLVGLVMLEPGSRIAVGRDEDSDLVVSAGPGRWGAVRMNKEGKQVHFDAAADSEVRVDGLKVDSVEMTLGGEGDPTQIEAGGIRIHLVSPGGRLALRVRDPEAESRTEFAGLDYYPLVSDWRLEAEFVPHPPGTTMQVANVMGQLIEEPNPGIARFSHEGRMISMEAVLEDDRLFFIFADRTSGRETYGLGRFLYSELPQDGRVVLDFNQAYNPPCAFNAFTTCPLPPQANRIDAWIRAGEKRYAGKPGFEKATAMISAERGSDS